MRRWLVLAGIASVTVFGVGVATGGEPGHGNGGRFERAGADATWTTVFKSPSVLEGLTAGPDGNLYTTLRNSGPCKVIRISPTSTDPSAMTVVGFVSTPCSPSGLAFGPDGALYVTGASSDPNVSLKDVIVRLVPDAATPPTATVYATNVAQANGIAFDRDGNLWATDGSASVGTVWEVPAGGGLGVEAFRVPAMRNDVGAGVGRSVSTFPTGTAQTIVTNGIAFTHDGDVLVADTARGAIWKAQLDSAGRVVSPMGCDTTYHDVMTLCLDDVLVQHPYLEGADGITLDSAGNIWAAANERNAIVVVAKDGSVQEFFRNAPGADSLRNEGPLETPTSPVVVGHTFCVANSDGNRRDNSPNTGGEVSNGGKVSCLDQPIDP
jgi:sugar lactone lactonase YvrE